MRVYILEVIDNDWLDPGAPQRRQPDITNVASRAGKICTNANRGVSTSTAARSLECRMTSPVWFEKIVHRVVVSGWTAQGLTFLVFSAEVPSLSLTVLESEAGSGGLYRLASAADALRTLSNSSKGIRSTTKLQSAALVRHDARGWLSKQPGLCTGPEILRGFRQKRLIWGVETRTTER